MSRLLEHARNLSPRAKKVILWASYLIILVMAVELALRVVSLSRSKKRLQQYPEIQRRYYGTEGAFRNYRGGGRRSRTDTRKEPVEREMLTQFIKDPTGAATAGAYEVSQIREENFPAISTPPLQGESKVRVLCIGGSTTAGTYPPLLEQLLRHEICSDDLDVIDLGFSGGTTRTSAYLLQKFLPRMRPDLVVVYHGFNDLVRFSEYVRFALVRPSKGILDVLFALFHDEQAERQKIQQVVLEESRRNYEEIRRFIADANGSLGELWVSSFALPDYDRHGGAERDYFDTMILAFWPQIKDTAFQTQVQREYNRRLVEWARQQGVGFVDIAGAFAGRGLDLFTDPCHRTPDGRLHHARALAEALSPRVTEIRARKLAGGVAYR